MREPAVGDHLDQYELTDFLDGDTDEVKSGMGTGGSRSTQVGGTAVKLASDEVLDKARHIAAHLLEADPGDIVVADGGLAVQGVPSSALSWAVVIGIVIAALAKL